MNNFVEKIWRISERDLSKALISPNLCRFCFTRSFSKNIRAVSCSEFSIKFHFRIIFVEFSNQRISLNSFHSNDIPWQHNPEPFHDASVICLQIQLRNDCNWLILVSVSQALSYRLKIESIMNKRLACIAEPFCFKLPGFKISGNSFGFNLPNCRTSLKTPINWILMSSSEKFFISNISLVAINFTVQNNGASSLL